MENNKLFENTVAQWERSVKQFCEKRGLKEIDLKLMHEKNDYNIYRAYKNTMFALEQYRRVPESFVYLRMASEGISEWYRATGVSLWTVVYNYIFNRQK